MSDVKCGKCLLSEFDMAFYAETVSDYIALIPEEKKTPAPEYNRRLDVCKACESLLDGMCGECGCFIEIRAAKVWMSCPCNKWKSIERGTLNETGF